MLSYFEQNKQYFQSNSLKVATVFSGGLAAPEWALKYLNVNHEVVFAAEIDKFARQLYLANHGDPSGPFYSNVKEINGSNHRDIDLFIGGSPCQSFSVAGKGGGFKDTRGTLFFEYARLVNEIHPRCFIYENVRGILSNDKGNTWKTILQTFDELGYHYSHAVLNAKDYGTPQNRQRVFVVGFKNYDDYIHFNFPDPIGLKYKLKDLLEDDVDEKYFLSDKMLKGFKEHKKRHEQRGNGFLFKPQNGNKVANCISTGYGTRATDTYLQERIDAALQGIDESLWKHHPTLSKVGSIGVSQGNRVYEPEIACTLKASGGGGGAKTGLYLVPSATKRGYEVAAVGDSINLAVPGSKTRRGRVGHEVAQTLDTSCNQATIIKPYLSPARKITRQNGRREKNDGEEMFTLLANEVHGIKIENSSENYRIRRLTPRECFRLMGDFEDRVEIVVSDTQAYKNAGNGMEIRTMMALLTQILQVPFYQVDDDYEVAA